MVGGKEYGIRNKDDYDGAFTGDIVMSLRADFALYDISFGGSLFPK